ncbi:hypothetical protein Tco_0676826 [Tanacetum coccineum]
MPTKTISLPLDGLHLDDKLHFVEEPLEIVGRGSTDKSKIIRKQSKASKHGHENQKSTKPKPQKTKALANFLLQGPILQIPKVIYNLKERKERQGPNVGNLPKDQ